MRIPVLGLGVASRTPFITAKITQNIYAETRPAGEKSQLVGIGKPGRNLFVDFGATPCRGGMSFETGNVSYVVHRGVLWEVNNAGVKTNRGSLLTTSGRVSMADNGTQIMIVDGAYGYIYNTQTLAFAQITDPDFPANPVTVSFLAGRFIVNLSGSSRFYASDLYNGLSWDALNFANAETNPDPIVANWVTNGQLILFGSVSTEPWGNSGAADFPFSLIQGQAAEWGLAATWSVAKFDNTLACLWKSRMGEVMVGTLSGYLPKKISTPDMDKIINGYANTADASAYSFMLGGHPMYVINFPSAGYSWLYDGSTGFWHSWKSYNTTRDRAEFGWQFLGKTILADYESGRLYRLDPTALTENGDPIEILLRSENVATPDLTRFTVDRFRIDVQVGVGTPNGQGSNPQIGLRVSRDNGKTWGAQMWRTLGPIGDYRITVDWDRLGTARNFVFELAVTDPVQVTIMSACVNPD